MTITEQYVTVETPTGPMRTLLLRPTGEMRRPAIVLYSEIFQITGPIRRLAGFLAGNGYVVAVPEVYHEYEPAGTVLAYDQTGSDRGNALKYTKPVAAHDSDAAALAEFLAHSEGTTGAVGAFGVCLGGHLAYRAALQPLLRGAVCFYATDLHAASLGAGGDDSLERAEAIRGELMMVWGRQDPHVPLEGRMKILGRLNEAGVALSWHEVNGAHAFLRDEGPRYDAALARTLLDAALAFFGQVLGQ